MRKRWQRSNLACCDYFSIRISLYAHVRKLSLYVHQLQTLFTVAIAVGNTGISALEATLPLWMQKNFGATAMETGSKTFQRSTYLIIFCRWYIFHLQFVLLTWNKCLKQTHLQIWTLAIKLCGIVMQSWCFCHCVYLH
jgi:hypothetical protein